MPGDPRAIDTRVDRTAKHSAPTQHDSDIRVIVEGESEKHTAELEAALADLLWRVAPLASPEWAASTTRSAIWS